MFLNRSVSVASRHHQQVQFIGEEGVDEGGVTKEFFQLLLRDLFDPSYGMFMYDHATRLHWFMPSQLDMEQEFRLVGIMVGLAIYNSQLLELAFPRLMYRKLVGETPCLADVEEVFPDIFNSLTQVRLGNNNNNKALLCFCLLLGGGTPPASPWAVCC